MLFNSLQFLLFFPVVTALYFALPHRWRWSLLLAASCWFYMAFIPVYILILALTIVVVYFAGLAIERSAGRRRKIYLVAGLVANIGVLAFFKYYNFLNDNLLHLFRAAHLGYSIPFLHVVLPIGLSFHTFQAMSYAIEVYRGRHAAERNFGIFALYVMFYPQLVAGPIERPQNLLHQFREIHVFDGGRVADGLKRMLWGLFQKVVVADRLAPFVNQVYDHPRQYEGLPLLLATVLFAFQIYADFAGYSDIAIGAAQVMGFRLMRNFNRPYFAKSITEFWKRWHISLSTWFRDYLYLPLGVNHLGRGRWLLNLFITFLVSGLWHGARWTFVIWGGLNGLYLVVEILAADAMRRVGWLRRLGRGLAGVRGLQMVWTFVLTCMAWVFFRAASGQDAVHILTRMITGLPGSLARLAEHDYVKANVLLGRGRDEFLLAWLAIAVLLGVHALEARGGSLRVRLSAWPTAVRWAAYYALLIAVLFFGAFNQSRQFIYFQF